MALYRIRHLKNTNNVIAHYAFHTVNGTSASRAEKKTKAQAIVLLEMYKLTDNLDHLIDFDWIAP